MYKNKKLKRLGSRKKLIVGLCALVILLGAGVYFIKNKTNDSITTDPGTTDQVESETVNLNEATNDEKKDADSSKKKIVEEQNKTPVSGPKAIITITSGNTNPVRAQVGGVVEDNGVCTSTFTKGSETKTTTASGFANVSYTQCGPMNGNLSSGTWSVVVNYKSNTVEGNSTSFTVVI